MKNQPLPSLNPNPKLIPESELILNPDGSVYHLGLLPEHLPDTVLTVGDPDRVEAVSRHFDAVYATIRKREFVTHIGRIGSEPIAVLSTGMGTDNVEIVMNELDTLANVDLKTRTVCSVARKLRIVRIGTSGSLQADIPVGTLLYSEYAVGLDTLGAFYDFKQGVFEKAYSDSIRNVLELPFQPYMTSSTFEHPEDFTDRMVPGTTVTLPGFYAPQGRQLRVKSRMGDFSQKLSDFSFENRWLTNAEMETAGYYALGRLMGHEVLSVNAILANRVTGTFAADPKEVVDRLICTILEAL